MQTLTRLTCLVVVLMSLVTPLAYAQGGEPAAVAVGTVYAERKPIAKTADFVGRIEAINRVEIRARVKGYLEAVLFKEGDLVKEGQPLYRIEKGLFEAAVEATEEAKALGEDQSGVVDVCGQLVEETAEQLKSVFHRRFEQLLLAFEVVVERTQPDVSGLGDLKDRDIESPGGEEALGGADEGRPRVRLAPFEPVARGCHIGHLSRLPLRFEQHLSCSRRL